MKWSCEQGPLNATIAALHHSYSDSPDGASEDCATTLRDIRMSVSTDSFLCRTVTVLRRLIWLYDIDMATNVGFNGDFLVKLIY